MLAVHGCEREMARDGETPDGSRLWLRRYRLPMELAGAFLLALSASLVAILLNFLVWNRVFHLLVE
jgi:hypothetical protein